MADQWAGGVLGHRVEAEVEWFTGHPLADDIQSVVSRCATRELIHSATSIICLCCYKMGQGWGVLEKFILLGDWG